MIKQHRLCLLFVMFLLIPALCGEALARPKIGLVLSGGGARGMAHIGVLKVLEDLRVPVDAIAATSMGAIVGGAYAAGLSPDEMEQIIGELDWKDLFTDTPSREFLSNRGKQDEQDNFRLSVGLRGGGVKLPQGAISGQKLDLFLRSLTRTVHSIDNFDRLPIPYRAIATDLTNGKMVVFKQGRLEMAMRSSMSIPGIISPTEIGSQLLVDGGLVRNLPVDIVRRMGVDLVIAVNLGTPLLERDALNSVVGVTVQMIAILTEQNVQASLESLRTSDILILPELGDISSADFGRAAEAIRIGVESAQAVSEQLSPYRLSKKAYAAWRERFQSIEVASTQMLVDDIRLQGLNRVNPQVLSSLIQTQTGQPLDEKVLEQDIARLYGRGDFDRITYRLQQEQGRQVLVIDAIEKAWGPNYLRFGLGFQSDFQGNNAFNLGTSYKRTWVNSLGAIWQTDLRLGEERLLKTEFYQPLAPAGPWFVAPYIEIGDRPIDLFRGDHKIAELNVTTLSAGVDVGLDLAAEGELRFGTFYSRVTDEPEIGEPDLPSNSDTLAGLRARYRYDGLDNLNFPGVGSAMTLEALAVGKVLGGERRYGRLLWSGLRAVPFGDGTLTSSLLLGARLGNDPLPVYDEFSLGGFLNLSGYQTEELRGQYLGFGRLVYYRPIPQLSSTFGGTVYLGGSLELGNTWESSSAIKIDDLHPASSAFIGADTLLGPLYLAVGLSDRDRYSLYLYLGRP